MRVRHFSLVARPKPMRVAKQPAAQNAIPHKPIAASLHLQTTSVWRRGHASPRFVVLAARRQIQPRPTATALFYGPIAMARRTTNQSRGRRSAPQTPKPQNEMSIAPASAKANPRVWTSSRANAFGGPRASATLRAGPRHRRVRRRPCPTPNATAAKVTAQGG